MNRTCQKKVETVISKAFSTEYREQCFETLAPNFYIKKIYFMNENIYFLQSMRSIQIDLKQLNNLPVNKDIFFLVYHNVNFRSVILGLI